MNPFRILPAIFVIFAMPAPAAAFFHSADADAQAGRDLYIMHCAACHGADLQGQPDWRNMDETGLFPAPPHDETGHTWHHDDAMLLDYIARGGQAALDDMNVAFTSGMPGFASVLTEREIGAILDYIKSTWPEPMRGVQAERSREEAASGR